MNKEFYKKCLLKPFKNNKSGIILFIVLWILVILSMLAISMGRGTNIDLTLAKHSIGKAKAKYAAWAGLIYAVNQIKADSENKESSEFDSLYQCAVPVNLNAPASDIFRQISLGDSVFEISYWQKEDDDLKTAVAEDKADVSVKKAAGLKDYRKIYGIQDEERKININALTPQNVNVFISLMMELGFDEVKAKTVAHAIVDWIDPDSLPSESTYGAENDYYEAEEGYLAKNLPFDSKEELFLVKGVDKDVFAALEDFITIYPQEDTLKVNYDTASQTVLNALAKTYAGPLTNTDAADAESLVKKMLEFRRGEDGIAMTKDDKSIDISQIPLNANERTIFLTINQFRVRKSAYLNVHVEAKENLNGVDASLSAVVKRDDLSVIQWRRH